MATGITKNLVGLFGGGGQFGAFWFREPDGFQDFQQFGFGDAHFAADLDFDFAMAANLGLFVPFQDTINHTVAVIGKLCGGHDHVQNIPKLGIFAMIDFM
jgi:hypothetical protein